MLTIYISVSVIILLVSCFCSGYIKTKDYMRINFMGYGALLAFIWPLCLFAACILAPFYLSYYLGKYVQKNKNLRKYEVER